MKLLLSLLLLSSAAAHSFTLEYSNSARFKEPEITVNVSSTTCNNNGYTPTEILDLAETAVTKFWNTVSSANVRLKRGTVVDIDTNQAGSSVDDSLATMYDAMDGQSILVGCTTNTNFISDAEAPSTLAKAYLNSQTQDRAIVIINNRGTIFGIIGNDKAMTTIAHEIGHALGLGHSDLKHALMFYNINEDEKVQEKLAYDDIDGLSYLYPHHSPSCGEFAMGTIADVASSGSDDSNNFPPMALMFIGFTLVALMRQTIKKLKPLVVRV